MSDDLQRGGRRRGARLGGRAPGSCCSRSSRSRARSSRRRGLVGLPARRGGGRARLRGRGRRGRRVADRPADPVEHRHRRLGARHPAAARARGRRAGSALRPGRRREHRLRAAGPDGVPLLHEERAARRAQGARPAAAGAVLARGDGAARPVREPGGDRARPAPAGAPRASAVLEAGSGDTPRRSARWSRRLDELGGRPSATAGVDAARARSRGALRTRRGRPGFAPLETASTTALGRGAELCPSSRSRRSRPSGSVRVGRRGPRRPAASSVAILRGQVRPRRHARRPRCRVASSSRALRAARRVPLLLRHPTLVSFRASVERL